MQCTISRSALAAIRAHAARDAPREACGLLLGTADRIEAAVPCANIASDPMTRFEVDPAALFAALRAERTGGPAIMGIYHSHPTGDPRPSRADALDAAPDGRLWLIVGGDDVMAWRASDSGAINGRFDAVELLAEG